MNRKRCLACGRLMPMPLAVGFCADHLPGQRIKLLAMTDDPNALPHGSEGEVTFVTRLFDDKFQLGVRWDNGRTLHLAVPPDTYEVLT